MPVPRIVGDDQRARHYQQSARDALQRQRFAQHEIGDGVGEQRRSLEQRRDGGSFLMLQCAQVEVHRRHIEQPGQRGDPHTGRTDHEHIGERPDNRQPRQPDQRCEDQQRADAGFLEEPLDQIFVDMRGHSPQHRAAEGERDPAQARCSRMVARNTLPNSFSFAAPTPCTMPNSLSSRGRSCAMSISDLSEKIT